MPNSSKMCLVDLLPEVEETGKELRETYGADRHLCRRCLNKDHMKEAQEGKRRLWGSERACCNAGVCRLAPFEEMSDEMRDFHIAVNIKCMEYVSALFICWTSGGSIVIASSVTGDIVVDAGSCLRHDKSGARGIDKMLGHRIRRPPYPRELLTTRIRAYPNGWKDGYRINPDNPESAIQDIAVGVHMKRLADPLEVGELFAFLGSDEASYLTGSQIVIDGGSTLPETMSMGTN